MRKKFMCRTVRERRGKNIILVGRFVGGQFTTIRTDLLHRGLLYGRIIHTGELRFESIGRGIDHTRYLLHVMFTFDIILE
ncbi:hypothetical protein D3C87_1867760 [compost metagenome]